MYRNSYQRGMLTIFFSVGSKPLNIWETHVQDGYIRTFLDQDIKSMVLEIGGTNVSTTYMTCPKGNAVLGITMPFLVMIVKNLKKYFTFEVTILDETGTRRRFRVSNFQSTTQILPLCTVMPIGLSDGWNQIQFNLAEFTRRAYKKQFIEVQKLQINANIRLRRIYFTERLIPEDQLPPEYKLYFPLASKGSKGKNALGSEIKKDKETIQVAQAPDVIEEKREELVTQADAIGSRTEISKNPSKKDLLKGSKTNVPKIPSEQNVTRGSRTDVLKRGSGASIHSAKMISSVVGSIGHTNNGSKVEIVQGSKQTSVVSIQATTVASGDTPHPESEAPNDEAPLEMSDVVQQDEAATVPDSEPAPVDNEA